MRWAQAKPNYGHHKRVLRAMAVVSPRYARGLGDGSRADGGRSELSIQTRTSLCLGLFNRGYDRHHATSLDVNQSRAFLWWNPVVESLTVRRMRTVFRFIVSSSRHRRLRCVGLRTSLTTPFYG